MNYEQIAMQLKAMADPKRVKIIDLLSCGDLCACDILEHFEFTQPTLSHHMKILEKAGIISVQKQSQWHYYSLENEFVQKFMGTMSNLFSNQEESCVCHTQCDVNESKIESIK